MDIDYIYHVLVRFDVVLRILTDWYGRFRCGGGVVHLKKTRNA